MALVQIFAQDKTFEQRVRYHFNRGICELTSVVNSLYLAKEDTGFYLDLKEHIEKATEELGITEKLVLEDLEKVDSVTSEILVSKKKLLDEQKAKENELASLQGLQKDLQRRSEMQREDYQRQKAIKEQAERDKAAAAEEIREQERRKKDSLWFGLIPIVGPVIGAIVSTNAHMAQQMAEERARVAQEMVANYSAKERKALDQVAQCEKQLKEQEDRVKATQESLETLEDKKKKLTSFHEEILNLQQAVRHCSHLVGTLHSNANAIMVTSRYVFLYNSLKLQTDSIMRHMLPFLDVGNTKHQLLDCPEIKRNIKKLKFFSETPSTLARNAYVPKDL